MIFHTKSSIQSRYGNRLREVSSDPTNWITEYIDDESGDTWLEYFPYREDRSPSFFRKKNIPESMEELIDVCLTSPDSEDWSGLGAHLSSGSVDCELLLEILKCKVGLYPKMALKSFGRALSLPDSRVLTGMAYEEVKSSYLRYISLRDQISELIK